MHQIIQALGDWYNHALQTGGYPAIALMMAVESSLFPLPSEIVIPPAAHWAHTGQIPCRSGASYWRAPSDRGSAPR
jgi:membrane protein YqaA with SNARE-associated domain